MRSALLLLPLAACVPSIAEVGVDCPNLAVPGVSVRVVDENGRAIQEPTVTWSQGDETAAPCDRSGDVWQCAWELSGTIGIAADAWGYDPARQSVIVQEDVCGPVTRELTLELPEIRCPDVIAYGLIIDVVTATGELVPWADVGFVPVGELWTFPEPCDSFGNGQFGCAEGWSGEIEVWAQARGYGSFYDLYDVPFDECGPITQYVTASLAR